MNIEISGQRYGKTFSVADYNSLLLQRDNVPLPNNLTITASGTGCALVQVNASLIVFSTFSVKLIRSTDECKAGNSTIFLSLKANVKYNIPTDSTVTEAFNLRSTVRPVNNNCMKRTLNICVR